MNHRHSTLQKRCDGIIPTSPKRGGDSFPIILHRMLDAVEREGTRSDTISWTPDGKGFIVHKPKLFAATVMPNFFNQTKYKSFQRQLNLYHFDRRPEGKVNGVYYHPLFTRDSIALCLSMRRGRRGEISAPFTNPPKNLLSCRTSSPPVAKEASKQPPTSLHQHDPLHGFVVAIDGSHRSNTGASGTVLQSLKPRRTPQQQQQPSDCFSSSQKHVGQGHDLAHTYLMSRPSPIAITPRASPCTSHHNWQDDAFSGNRFGSQNILGEELPDFTYFGRSLCSGQPPLETIAPIVSDNSESLEALLGRIDTDGRSLLDDDSIESLDYIDPKYLDDVGPVTEWED